MKTYCFNYAIEGMSTLLPLFMSITTTNQFKAYRYAKSYAKFINEGKSIKMWFKNFPHANDVEFGTTEVPQNWIR